MFQEFPYLHDWSSSTIAILVFVPAIIVLLIARLKKGLWPFDQPSDDDLDWDLGFYTSIHDRERDGWRHEE